MNQSVNETKRRLANLSSYRHHLDGVEKADLSENGMSHWRSARFRWVSGRISCCPKFLPRDSNTVVFKSVDGDLEVMGMVSFHAVKNNLTEVDLVVNYESSSPMFKLLDRMLNVGDHFLINQLRRVRAHFEGIAAPVQHPVSVYSGATEDRPRVGEWRFDKQCVGGALVGAVRLLGRRSEPWETASLTF